MGFKMSSKDYLIKIILELSNNANYISNDQLAYAIEAIIKAPHIFIAGAGRSGIMAKGFANRLLHLGFSVSLIGDIISPHSKPGDLIIINSGSGETDSLVSLVKKAKDVQILTFTMNPNSTIARFSDIIIQLPGVSPKVNNLSNIISIQPMASVYEQISLLTYDAIILELMDKLEETSESMFLRHADFE